MAVEIELKGRRIEIASPRPITGLRTTIPGAYLTVSGKWTVPLSIESCRLLRERFGTELRIGKALSRWARIVVQNRRQMAALSEAEDAELETLPTVAPRLARAMDARTYQKVGVRFVAENEATLIADDPGLGKTLIAIGGILEAGIPGPYLVIAPKTAADSVWAREITRWLPRKHRAVTLPEMRHNRERTIRLTRYGDTTWLIVHPEIVLVQSFWVCKETVLKRGKRRFCNKRTVEGSSQKKTLSCKHTRDGRTEKLTVPAYPHLFAVEWGAVINDESHENLIRRKGVPTQRRRGLDMLRLRSDGVKLALSGTPFDSHPEYLWGTLNWLYPKQYPAYHRWAELFWTKGGYTGHEIGEFRKDREKLMWDSLATVALRRTKAEVAKDLPPKLYVGTPYDANDSNSPVGVWLEMDGKQEAAYRAMEALSIAELDSGRLEAITGLEELTRLKQLATAYGRIEPNRGAGKARYRYFPALPSNKFKWTVEALEEWGYPRDPLTKVVIVSWYTGILQAFSEGLERHFRTKPDRPLCTAITGRTPMRDRRSIIDRFNQRDRDSPRIMMLNVKAGGTAITLDTADRMIFLTETGKPDQQKQAEDRIHRVSNPRQCMYYYLRSLGTVDVGTALSNVELDRISHRLLDGRRGIEYMRHVLELSGARG